jgi:hypothetical protein
LELFFRLKEGTPSMADLNPQPLPPGATLRGSVHIQVTENISLGELHALVTQIAGMSGCRTCGIMGIDLRLSGDPVESQPIAKLPGVKSVSFGG